MGRIVVAARAALRFVPLVAALLAGCGVLHHDVTIAQEIKVGGGVPTASGQIDAAALTTPLVASAGELSKLSSVTLQSARLEATDGDLTFVDSVTLSIAGNRLPDALLATLLAHAAVGQTSSELSVDSKRDLRAYLAAGSQLKADLAFAPRPVVARGLKLTLVVRGSL